MKKGLKKLVAGIITSVTLCLPIVGFSNTTNTTAYAYKIPGFAELDKALVHDLHHIKTQGEFDIWFEDFWNSNHHIYKNKLETYITFYKIWNDIQNPPGAGIKPPSLRPY